MGLLKKYCKAYTFPISLALILKAVSTGFTLFLPWAFTHLVNEIVPLNSTEELINWGAIMIFMALGTMILSLTAAHLSVKFGVDISKEIREDVFKKSCDETLGIIGSTGSGKSTIISLMLRLYEPSNGEIFLEGKPINSYSKESLYQKFGVVFQSDIIFAETVSENIAFGRNISEKEVKFASEIAHRLSTVRNADRIVVIENGEIIEIGTHEQLLLNGKNYAKLYNSQFENVTQCALAKVELSKAQ